MPLKKPPKIAVPIVGDTALPLMSHSVKAGFPSPAMDFMENRIDLNRELAQNHEATFYIRVDGHSMTGAGIDDGDILVIDRSLEPENRKIAVCFLDGEFTVKRLIVEGNKLFLMPENEAFPPIPVTEESQFMVWGIVTYVVKKL